MTAEPTTQNMTAATCNNCATCHEDAKVIPLYGRWFVRVRRISKCKRPICKTEWCDSKRDAINTWNIQFGEQVDAEESARAFAGKANLCTHAGIYNLALPLFYELFELRRAGEAPSVPNGKRRR